MQQVVTMIALPMLVVGENIRKYVDPTTLRDLVISIKLHGILKPLHVYAREDGKYEIEDGQRRYLAAPLAGLSEAPCLVIPRPADAVEIGLKQHAANNQSEHESIIEKGLFYQSAMDAKGWTCKQLAWETGADESDISRAVKTLRLLPQALHAHVQSGALAGRTAYEIARAKLGDEKKVEIGEMAVAKKLTGPQVREAIAAAAGKKVTSKKTTIKVKTIKVQIDAPPSAAKQDIVDALAEALAQAKRGELPCT